jgi:hypothetical protein
MGGGAYRVTVEKSEGKRPPERSRCKLKNNIKINFKEMESDGVHWCVLLQNGNKCWGLVNAIMNLTVARKMRNFFVSARPLLKKDSAAWVIYLFI